GRAVSRGVAWAVRLARGPARVARLLRWRRADGRPCRPRPPAGARATSRTSAISGPPRRRFPGLPLAAIETSPYPVDVPEEGPDRPVPRWGGRPPASRLPTGTHRDGIENAPPGLPVSRLPQLHDHQAH